jgi:hypothetical protein
MSRLLYFCLMILLAASIGYAQKIDGKWKGQMQSPNGSMDLVFNFKTDGDTLTGSVEGPMGDTPISNGKNEGKTFSFDVSFGDMTISHICTFMSDSILMKVPGMQGDTMEITLFRLPEEKKK